MSVQASNTSTPKKEDRKRILGVDSLQLLSLTSNTDEKSKGNDFDMSVSDDASSNNSVGSSSSQSSIFFTKKSLKRQRYQSSDEDEERASNSEFHSSMSSVDDEHDGDLASIHTIIAKRKFSKHKWNDICKNMNTCEIERGSLWSNARREMNENELHREEIRYLIRWEDCSYIHCSWETERDLLEYTSNGEYQVRAFNAQFNDSGTRHDASQRNNGEFFDPDYIKIDRILDIQEGPNKGKVIFDPNDSYYGRGTGRQFLIKWKSRNYGESSYEHERDLINMNIEYESHVQLYLKRIQKPSTQKLKDSFVHQERYIRSLYKVLGDTVSDKNDKVQEYVKELQNVPYPVDRQLRSYQAEGLAWLIGNYINRRSSILADEMGLGKTISSAAFLQTLSTSFHNRGPFLIIAPLSTLPQWHRELNCWTDLNIVMYTGNAMDKAIIHEFEFPFHSDRPKGLRSNQKYLKNCHKKIGQRVTKKSWMPNIVITSPESFIKKDGCELTDVEWEVLVFDEAHARLKNDKSRLSLALRDEKFVFKYLLLLTGTPIQNNTTELWNILNVVDRTKFGDREYFLERYGNMKSKEQLEELHSLLRPYILRRLKEDVEKTLPPKEETIIEVELTVLQKQYYRALFEKNIAFLNRGDNGFKKINNVCMQLRKCCNHPYLIDGVENLLNNEHAQISEHDDAESLVKASGKLVLLDKLLPKLKDGGHRVLLFSQFKIMLDIIEDYLISRNFGYERIDGDVIGSRRQQAIDRFQSPDSSSFIMILSTKAGGVGINLTGADTCILFDSDWNPQNDLQAQARCHRIGQKKAVKVYRLLCRKSYEMRLFQLASMKMGLEKVVMNGVENGVTKAVISDDDAERLLRYGAYDVFSEDPSSENDTQKFLDEDIDTILLRRTTTKVEATEGSKLNFSKAWFRGGNDRAIKDDREANDVDVDDPDFWFKIMNQKLNTSVNVRGITGDSRHSPVKLDVIKERSDMRSSKSMDDSEISISSADSWGSQNKLLPSHKIPPKLNARKTKKTRNLDSQSTRQIASIKSPKNARGVNLKSSIEEKSSCIGSQQGVTSPVGFTKQRKKSQRACRASLNKKYTNSTSEVRDDLLVPSYGVKNNNKSSSPRKSPRKHVIKGSYKEHLLCSRCGAEFSSEPALEYHMDKMVCLKDMNQIESTRVDMSNKSLTICEHCSRQFAVPAGLQYHLLKKVCMPSHMKSGTISISSVTNNDLNALVDDNSVLKCPKCSKTFRMKGRLKSHIAKNICDEKKKAYNRNSVAKQTETLTAKLTIFKHNQTSYPVSSEGNLTTIKNETSKLKKDTNNYQGDTNRTGNEITKKSKSRVSFGSDILLRLVDDSYKYKS